MYRSQPLEKRELLALLEEESEQDFLRDEDSTSEECDLDSECSEDGRGSRGVRSSLSLQIYGLQREQRVFFSNQEYYRRLEELKSAHLRNMAELERMYISQAGVTRMEEDEGYLGGDAGWSISGPTRRLQRINSQEELDFNETSSASDQSELSGEDNVGETVLDDTRTSPGRSRTFGRDSLLRPEDMMPQKLLRCQPNPHQTGVRRRSNSKVTVPKPFQMMLREEERKRHKVRTRSEIQLEKTLLRRELDELRECQKKFRASPAPAHIHLPLYEIISNRSARRPNRRNNSNPNIKREAPPQPFHFLEREKRKRESKILAELARLGPKEERRAFKARPLPSSVYGTRHRDDTESHQAPEREDVEHRSDPSSDMEPDATLKSEPPSPQRCPASRAVKKQIELSIEMVKERQWPGIDPLKPSACNI